MPYYTSYGQRNLMQHLRCIVSNLVVLQLQSGQSRVSLECLRQCQSPVVYNQLLPRFRHGTKEERSEK